MDELPTEKAHVQKPKGNFSLRTLLRLLVTAVLLALVARTVNFAELLKLLENINWSWMLLACGILLSIRVLMAYRWHYILASHGVDVSLRELIRVIMISLFVGQILPGSIGPDVVRGYELVRNHGQFAKITTTVVLDRVIGAFSMFFLAAIGTLIAESTNLSTGVTLLLIFLPIAFLAGWFLLYLLAPVIKKSLLNSGILNQKRFGSKLLLVFDAVTDLSALKSIFPAMFAISVVVQLLRTTMFYCLYQSLGEAVSYVYYVAFIPITYVIILLPISLGGLGVREGALVYFMGELGISSEVSVSVGLISHALQILISLPSSLLWTLGGYKKTDQSKSAMIPQNTVVDIADK